MTTTRNTSAWSARELVMIGVFAASAKIAAVLIALAGGGINPVSLVLKNLVYTTLMVILLTKIPKPGTLLLFTFIGMLVSIGLLGGSITLLPGAIVGAIVGELAIWLTGGAQQKWAAWIGTAVYDFFSKGLALVVALIFLRESPNLMTIIVPVVSIGYLGCLIGLLFARKTVGELKHAGFIR